MKKRFYVVAYEKGSKLIGVAYETKERAKNMLPLYKEKWKDAVVEKRMMNIITLTKEEKADLVIASKFLKRIQGLE